MEGLVERLERKVKQEQQVTEGPAERPGHKHKQEPGVMEGPAERPEHKLSHKPQEEVMVDMALLALKRNLNPWL